MKTIKQPKILQSELNKISRYVKEVSKFGYKPWVNVRQSHTYGQGHEIYCHKTQKTHCLLSRGERPIFFELERNPSVIDLFDQYPLPIFETMALAEKLNILHPGAYKERHKNDGVIPAKTMTSDIVALKRLKSGKEKLVVYSFKYKKSLDKTQTSPQSVARTEKKLELEKAFWTKQGIEFVLVNEDRFSFNYIYNLEYLRECYDFPDELDVSEDFYWLFIRELRNLFLANTDFTLKQHLTRVSQTLNIDLHQTQSLFQKAVYEFDLEIDLETKVELYRPVPLVFEEVSDAS